MTIEQPMDTRLPEDPHRRTKPGELAVLENATVVTRRFDAEAMLALDAITTGEIPPTAIQTHPGKGGKIFSYVSHIWATRTLNAGLKFLWGMRVVGYTCYDDGSANALVELVLDIPQNDGTLYRRVIQEVGAFESKGDGMKKAMIVASAASRGLLRCCLRAFNLGSNLYEEEEQLSPKDAWNALRRFCEERGVARETLLQAIRTAGIKGEELVDKFPEAWKIAATLVNDDKNKNEEVPGGL